MLFPAPLLRARLVRRYKRFFADVELADGSPAVAHCPNPGSMMGLLEPGAEVWLSRPPGPGRKLAYALELIRAPAAGGCLVGVNTGRTNALAAEAIAAGAIAELFGYAGARREVRYGAASRVDFLLEDPGRPPCYVEVKSVTLRRDAAPAGLAEFPDAVTKRGARHLAELQAMAAAGARAVMLFVAQRDDCDRFAVARDIDPAYAAAFAAATAGGVEVLCYGCAVTPEAVAIDRPLALCRP